MLMSSDQKNKTNEFIGKPYSPVRERIFRDAVNAANTTAAESSSRNETTNKHDIHLYSYAAAQPYWQIVKYPLSRTQLHSTVDQRDDATTEAYNTLAALFHDYENVVFQNQTVKYASDRVKVTPYEPRIEEMTTLANCCWELDPQSAGCPLRNGAWIK